MKKKLLVLGGNPYQSTLVQAGKDLSYHVTVFDQNPNCKARSLADYFVQVSIADKEACLPYAQDVDPEGICTAGTDFTTTVSYLCDKLSLPSNRYVPSCKAASMSAKNLIRHRLERHDIPQPMPWFVVEDGDPSSAKTGSLPLPLIVKPCRSMGSRGVVIVRDLDLLTTACRYAQRADPSRMCIIEPYIEADKFISTDSMWLDGRMLFLATATRDIRLIVSPHTGLSYPIEQGHEVPAELTPEEYESIHDTMLDVGVAFHYGSGFIKGDLMLKDGRCYVGEVAARVSGSFNSGVTIPLVYGINLHEAVVKLCMGEPDLTQIFADGFEGQGCAVERTLITLSPFTVKAINLDYESLKLAVLTDIFVREGDQVRAARTNVDKIAQVVAFSSSCPNMRQYARERANIALNGIQIEGA